MEAELSAVGAPGLWEPRAGRGVGAALVATGVEGRVV